MKNLKLSGLLLTLLATSAGAEVTDKDIATCAIVAGTLARVGCYDNIAKANQLNGPQSQLTSTQGNGEWNVSVDINPIDDSETVVLSLSADSGKGRWNKTVFLMAVCKSNTTEVFINWQDYLGREARVLTRVGKDKAVTQNWGISTNSQATFHNKPIQFLKKLLDSNKLVAQITPYGDNPITAIFNTTGLANAIKPLRKTCGW